LCNSGKISFFEGLVPLHFLLLTCVHAKDIVPNR
jgi:hypothetical protein